jgi:hypothetical protein
MPERSTILTLQDSLFRELDSNIITTFTEDGHTLFVNNLTVDNVKNCRFIANNPSFGGVIMTLADVQLYLDNFLQPTPIQGLYEIMKLRSERDDSMAYVEGLRTYQPYLRDFQGGPVDVLTNKLSALSRAAPDTEGRSKKYSFTFKNAITFT